FLALDPARAAMALDDLFRDVKAEPQAAVVRRRHLPSAVEALEDLLDLIGRNPDAAVADGGHDGVAPVLDDDVDVAPLGRVLHGILEQVAQDLFQTIAIAVDDAIGLVRDVE